MQKNARLLLSYVALPQDHGSWVFLLSPLLVGLFAGRSWKTATLWLIVGSLAAFLLRQPVTIAVKIISGRRPKREMRSAIFWITAYGFVGLICLAGLIWQGYSHLLYLAIPGIPVFIWHLILISKRAERRQMGVEIIGTGVLALVAPAAYWVSVGQPYLAGWLLFILIWLQSAASIVYAYLRLDQRKLEAVPSFAIKIKLARRALLYSSFNLLFVFLLGFLGYIPLLIAAPYSLQWIETIWGSLKPAVGVRPTAIGIRQLLLSALFTLFFILIWTGKA